MHLTRKICAAALLLLAGVGCGKDGTGPDEGGPPVTTTLSCDQGGGQTTSCTIPLAGASSFTITLVSRDCDAHSNVVSVISPVDSKLTSDACYAKLGSTWTYPGPFTGAASLNLSVYSRGFQYPPALRVSGAAPQWTINFEDGADQDFNDIVLTVKLTP